MFLEENVISISKIIFIIVLLTLVVICKASVLDQKERQNTKQQTSGSAMLKFSSDKQTIDCRIRKIVLSFYLFRHQDKINHGAAIHVSALNLLGFTD